jgi:hypothetical protein
MEFFMGTYLRLIRKVVVVPYDAAGWVVEGDFRDGVIGEAATFEAATALAIRKGYRLLAYETPDRVPGECIDADRDAFAIGVEA